MEVETGLRYFRTMLTIRRLEERINELFGQGRIRGTTHLSAGQEAVAVGVCAALRPDDQVTSTHRGHGHFIAKGGEPKRILAELYGKATGYARGRGGSQHMACHEIGFLGANGITGGGIPIATGAALAAKMLGTDRVVVCFFGDGATAQGTFHESLNIASLWKLPIVYVCENNLYAMSTPVHEACAVPDIAARAAAYAMPGVSVDGSDVFAVREATAEAVARARRGEGPTLLECKTYRFFGHSKSDDCAYRSREEEEYYKKRDPVALLRRALVNEGGVSEEELCEIEREVEKIIDEAVEFAEDSPLPEGLATDGVYA